MMRGPGKGGLRVRLGREEWADVGRFDPTQVLIFYFFVSIFLFCFQNMIFEFQFVTKIKSINKVLL
jgi:hypothetical protein